MRDLSRYAAENYGILYSEIKHFYGGWRRRRLAGMLFFVLLVVIAFFLWSIRTKITPLSRRFVLGASDMFLVCENPTCSVPVL